MAERLDTWLLRRIEAWKVLRKVVPLPSHVKHPSLRFGADRLTGGMVAVDLRNNLKRGSNKTTASCVTLPCFANEV